MQSDRKEISRLILDAFVEACETSQAERGKKRPHSLKGMSSETREVIKKAVCNAVSQGIRGEIEKNTSLEKYESFSDGIASELTGRLDIKMQYTVKAGSKQLEDQVHFIETKRPEYKSLYPAFLGEARFNKHNDEYNYVCLMEYLADYTSLHEMIFKSQNQDKWEVSKAIDSVFEVLFRMYREEHNKFGKPNLISLYLEERIKSRLREGKERFNTEVIFRPQRRSFFKDFEALLQTKIEIGNVVLNSFDHCLASIENVINEVTPSFTTLVHGDAHPANFMINLSNTDFPVKFLDPNVYIQNSDYLYDMGKMIHWLENFGFIALERTRSKKIVNVTIEPRNGKIKIEYEFDPNFEGIDRLFELRNYSLGCAYKKIEAIADYFEDTHWRRRLDLSTASAYIGGLKYVDEPSQFLICFVEALRYINKFLDESSGD